MTSSAAKIVRQFAEAQDSLVIQAADMSLETVAAMVEHESIDTQPQYQRRERWEVARQSALIESFLLNIPVPPVYLAEEDFGTYSVIDGKQRLTTIKKFMRNEFQLQGILRFTDLAGYTFADLPKDLANALRIRPYVRVVTLLKQSNPLLKYEVFTRLNTGGVTLEAQEVRNAMYRGTFNDLLVELSEDPFLRKQLKIKSLKENAYLSMADVEYVLRFFTMYDTWTSFSGDYRRSMDEYMESNRRPSASRLSMYRSLFQRSMTRCAELWGYNSFRRFDRKVGGYRDQFLSALYDAQAVSVARLTNAQFSRVLLNKNKIVAETKKIFGDKDFEDAIRLSTNSPSRVKSRIEAVGSLLA